MVVYSDHPGYVGGAISIMGVPLLLGSFWALIPASVYVDVLVVRTALDDQTLKEELEGYEAYANMVKYRLVPKV